VLKAIYEERGYRSRDIPRLILENNLFGLDIDDRAAQLAGFALLMKAREDDRRIFSRGIRMNVMALQGTQHLDASALWRDLNLTGDWHQGQSQSLFESEQKPLSSNDSTYKAIVDLIERFQDAKTFGSLIELPNSFEAPLKTLLEEITELAVSGDTMQKTAARQLMPIVQQAWLLAQRYDAVIANPPYMGRKGMNKALKDYAISAYPNSKSDLFAIFMEHGFTLLKENAFNAMVTMQSWMFLSSYEKMRQSMLDDHIIETMVHMGNGVMKIAFGTNATVFRNQHIKGLKGLFSYAGAGDIADNGEPFEFPVRNERLKEVAPDDLKKIPGSPIAYWVTEEITKNFTSLPQLKTITELRVGMATSDNDRFLRIWHEISLNKKCTYAKSHDEATNSGKKWFPYSKGGEARKWYGNNYLVVNWETEGREIIELATELWGSPSKRIYNVNYFFKPAITWSLTSSSLSGFCARWRPEGFIFDVNGMSSFMDNGHWNVLCAVNSKPGEKLLSTINPTMAFQAGDVARFPIIAPKDQNKIKNIFEFCVEIAKADWDSFETSWDFNELPLIKNNLCQRMTLKESWKKLQKDWREIVLKMQEVEEKNNSIFIESYGLQEELTPEISLEEITLTCNPNYRYGGGRSKEELETLLQCDTLKELVSYAIGCMMGRYSLDKPGLILASQGETIRDYLAQIPEPSFAPDENAIIPLTDQEWFPDDATNRFRDFVRTVWGEEHLQENLDFVAESLCLHAIKPKKGEAALETIRRYLSTQFFKDHLRTYKKRPIYWLFSSGKQKAFECLVYLHRYNESTLAEMRTDYVIPLTEKLSSYVEKLEQDKEASASAAEAKSIDKELSRLYKQQAELNTFDEKLRHYADQRISLDLDDGVKVNYGKFGGLLAEVKAVTGEKAK